MAEAAMNLRRRPAAIADAREAKTRSLEDGVDDLARRVERLVANGTVVTVRTHIQVVKGKLTP